MQHVIDFIVFPEALGLDITGPLEVFTTATAVLARKGKGGAGYRARFVGAQKGPVRLSSGLEIVADATFEETSPADTLLVPGGSGARDVSLDSDCIAYVRNMAGHAKRLVSVCNGAFVLAAAGLLDGKQATTHWVSADELAGRYPAVDVTPDAIYTCDGKIYTSAGVTTGIDLAIVLVEEDLGVSIAMEVSRLLVLYYRRPGSQSQYSAPLKAQYVAGRRFATLYEWLADNLNQPISVEQMAERSAMSQRHFARVFKSTTGMTPSKFLEILRLDRARELLSIGSASLERIAEVSGFGREERLRRAFIRRFKVTPSQYRLHFMKS